MSMPSEVAWNAALGTLRWLMDHADHGIVYDSGYNEVITSRNASHSLSATDMHAHTDSGHGTAQGPSVKPLQRHKHFQIRAKGFDLHRTRHRRRHD
eukprot:COSAG01_NODE_22436_length_855_cov_3.997354_2_plen_95_part_01